MGLKIVVLGSGVQGTVYGVRLARAGHDVTLVARGGRAIELTSRGAAIRNASTASTDVVPLPVIERLTAATVADLCLVCVRREQLDDALPQLQAATRVARFVVMVNHADGSESLYAALGRERVVLAFPGVAGGNERGVIRYLDVREQATAIAASAPDVAAVFRKAGFRVVGIRDMEAWLRRHAIFVTAIAGALYVASGDPRRVASDRRLVRTFVLAVREGWAALDRRSIGPPPLSLRAIFLWVPLAFALRYWCRLLRSSRGEPYFAIHARHAPREMAALAADVRSLIEHDAAPNLRYLFGAIDRASAAAALPKART